MESTVLGRQAENKFYSTTLSRCLDKHSEQMQKLTRLESSGDQNNILFSKYNQAIQKLQSLKEDALEQDEEDLKSFIKPYRKLRSVAESLKRYQQSMNFFRWVLPQDFKKIYLYQAKIETKTVGILSLEQQKFLSQNKKFIESQSFYELSLVRTEIQKFLDYLQQELQKEMVHYSESFLQRLITVLTDPINLWCSKGWQILTRRRQSKDQIMESSYNLIKLCEDLLSLNAQQFYYVCLLKGKQETLSHREQEAVKALLREPKIQKHLLLKGIITGDDIEDISKDWQKILYHLMKTNYASDVLSQKEIHNKKNNTVLSSVEFIEQLDTIDNSDAAFRNYGFYASLLKVCQELSKDEKSLWIFKKSFISNNHYDSLISKLVKQSKLFCSQKDPNISYKDFIRLLRYIDQLTLLYQSHEIELSKTDIGKRFLYAITQIIKQLSQFQTDYLYHHERKDELKLSHT